MNCSEGVSHYQSYTSHTLASFQLTLPVSSYQISQFHDSLSLGHILPKNETWIRTLSCLLDWSTCGKRRGVILIHMRQCFFGNGLICNRTRGNGARGKKWTNMDKLLNKHRQEGVVINNYIKWVGRLSRPIYTKLRTINIMHIDL